MAHVSVAICLRELLSRLVTRKCTPLRSIVRTPAVSSRSRAEGGRSKPVSGQAASGLAAVEQSGRIVYSFSLYCGRFISESDRVRITFCSGCTYWPPYSRQAFYHGRCFLPRTARSEDGQHLTGNRLAFPKSGPAPTILDWYSHCVRLKV